MEWVWDQLGAEHRMSCGRLAGRKDLSSTPERLDPQR